ncbi:MAG: SGNH/GDSL hydrolase family protein [Acidobacteriota bacterium]|nr:SGNH/GDSL hydrolase family protein [Acidobacteriota bacterium]
MRRILLVCIVVQVLLGGVASKIYLAQHNTLHANGKWVSTKTQLERGLMGAFSFVTERQSLAGGALNLGAWHGNQEVFYHRPVTEVQAIKFDFQIDEDGYVVVLFDGEPEGGSAGVRFGAGPRHPSAFLEVTADGEFLRKELLDERSVEGKAWHRARIELEAGRVIAKIDGRELSAFNYERQTGRLVGFRGGGRRPVLLDNVEITLVSGETFSDDFNTPRSVLGLALVVSVILIALNLGLFFLLARVTRSNRKTLGYSFLMVNLTMLVIGVLLFAFVLLRAGSYPGVGRALAEKEEYFGKGTAERVVAEIHARYPPPEMNAGDGRGEPYRILFLGTSQTWGAGARREEETFVAGVEAILNTSVTTGRRYECINAGFSSLKAKGLLPILNWDLLPLRPEVLLINLSSNDRSNQGGFAANVRQMVESARQVGIRTVLIKEANDPGSTDRGLLARYAELDQVGAEFGLPVIDMHEHLRNYDDSGFLWWDHVHLTAYGQRLIAEKLAAELELMLTAPPVA